MKVKYDNKALAPLASFLRTGELGPLNLDLSVNDVHTLLGKPLNDIVDRNLRTLYYYKLQISFFDDKMVIFNVLLFVRRNLPYPLPSDWCSVVRKMTYDDFLDYVRWLDVPCKKYVPNPDFEGSDIEVGYPLLIGEVIPVEVLFTNGNPPYVRQFSSSRIGAGIRLFESCF